MSPPLKPGAPATSLRLVFAGTAEVALPSLRRLVAGPHEVVAVLTRPAQPSGRGQRLAESPVALLAQEHQIPVLTPAKVNDEAFLEQLQALQPDCCPIVAYGSLIGERALTIPRYGWVNLHFSLLPAWRGAAPVQHAVLAGDAITGASTFALEAGLDTGPIYGVVTETIGPHDTAGQVLDRLADSGAALLEASLAGIATGQIVAQPQPAQGVSEAPKLSGQDARVRWQEPGLAIDRRIRACTPAPGAWTTRNTARGEQRLKLGPVQLQDTGPALAPGQVRVDKHHVWVGTGSMPVRLGWVQAPGKQPMDAATWARGAHVEQSETWGA